ncbi:hypothetical protein [Amycolatopsis albispora]|uniref:WXG100 family type VII secretion target n=1 Tax=Amycolatopsis albispora TaxID=1804986 RepID=A0A344L241_9PSEU|nr:hypothetical protein [Amycolatopsis albispora]AXB42115.1 hypothetical protein A4R43_05880 [Amycolatopsis albispora]
MTGAFRVEPDAARSVVRSMEDLNATAATSAREVGSLAIDIASFAGIGSAVGSANASLQQQLTGALGRFVELIGQISEYVRLAADGYTAADDATARGYGGGTGHGGTQGGSGTQLPGPGPQPATDPGAGAHASQQPSLADQATWQAAYAGADVADGIGWTNASSHLKHFLDNSGTPVTVDADQIARDVPSFRGVVDRTVTEQMRELAAEAARTGNYGTPVTFDSGWHGHYLGPAESKNWYYAMGGVQYSVTGVATVHPPAVPGGAPTIEMDYRAHVFDRYNWDGGKATQIGPMTVTDASLAELHRSGLAQEYNISGSTDPRHYSGAVPGAGTQVALPQSPDNRDGTRWDLRR